MNDLYGLSPYASHTLTELSSRFSTFGPAAGRYLLSFPNHNSWRLRVIDSFKSSLGEVAQKRLNSILGNAVKNSVFIGKWPGNDLSANEWLAAAIDLWEDKQASLGCGRIYVSYEEFEEWRISNSKGLQYLISPDDDDTVSSASERIQTDPESYWKICELICFISAEIHIVDPYFDPVSDQGRLDICRKLLREINSLKKPCQVHFWSRCQTDGSGERELNIKASLLKKKFEDFSIGIRQGLSVKFHWIDDYRSSEKLHARFLLTEKGGIKFDQGFQILTNDRRNIVSPLSKDLCAYEFEKFTRVGTSISKLPFKILKTIKL